MSLLVTRLTGETIPCQEERDCTNGPSLRGYSNSKCRNCKLALAFGGTGIHWKPVLKRQHPVLVAENYRKAKQKAADNLAKRQARDRGKVRRLESSVRAEKKTQTTGLRAGAKIKATKNSGRTNQDGDHQLETTSASIKVSLDTKLQSQAANPTIRLSEIDKVRKDSGRAQTALGGLVIVNKYGRRVVVFDYIDFIRVYSPSSE